MDLSLALLYGPMGSEGDPNAYFSLLKHTKQLLFVKVLVMTAGVGSVMYCEAMA